jgi:transcription initiation factor TFIID subunit TAF12
MKISLFTSLLMVSGLLAAGVAFGNPSMLPEHPGYPMGKAIDPVKGQPLANDPGRTNATGDSALNRAAASDDGHVSQKLSINDENKRLLEKPGAGLLPKVQGPNIVIEPPVKEATKVQAAPQ